MSRDWSPEDGPPPAALLTGNAGQPFVPEDPQIPYMPAGKPGQPLPPQFGPRPARLSRTAINVQVDELVERLVRRVRNLGAEVGDGAIPLDHVAATLKLMLRSQPPARERAATIIAETLLDIGERNSPDFWGTDLGCALAREIGYAGPATTRQVAASVLRMSRQAVSQMVARGDLREDTTAGVLSSSLRDAARARWPYDQDEGAEENPA